ncbi:hypothetical protein L1887_00928 [Cichorium endivia]|nr:hypothetical protein L1887_00928 [Cichorium endivia]
MRIVRIKQGLALKGNQKLTFVRYISRQKEGTRLWVQSIYKSTVRYITLLGSSLSKESIRIPYKSPSTLSLSLSLSLPSVQDFRGLNGAVVNNLQLIS